MLGGGRTRERLVVFGDTLTHTHTYLHGAVADAVEDGEEAWKEGQEGGGGHALGGGGGEWGGGLRDGLKDASACMSAPGGSSRRQSGTYADVC